VVENFMARRVNGIVLAPLDSQALSRRDHGLGPQILRVRELCGHRQL
jgi:hypothetical protein